MNNESNKIGKDENQESKNTNIIDTDNSIPAELLEAIPESERSKFIHLMSETLMTSQINMSNPVADKITEEHITQIISKSDEYDKRDRAERKSERNYNLIILIIALLFVVFIIVFLKTEQDLLLKIVIAIISFIGGFGFGQTKRKK